MSKEIKNVPASIHERLRKLARERGRTFQEVFYYFAIERFLYRLSKSPYKDSFVLKGGLAFFGWGIDLRRPTRDIDALGLMDSSLESLVLMVREICLQPVEPDGMRFDPESIRGEQIIVESEQPGYRMYINGYLGEAFIQLYLDISFGNTITPGEVDVTFPTLLLMPSFNLRSYPYETAIAEKFEAMVSLGEMNNRMKDFFDIWLLSEKVELPGKTLSNAIQETFRTRHTALPGEVPVALSKEFGQARQDEWERFLKRSNLEATEFPMFVEILEKLRGFIWPVVKAAMNNLPFELIWYPAGPWQIRE